MIDKIKLREKIRDKYQNRILEGDTKEESLDTALEEIVKQRGGNTMDKRLK